MYETWSAFCRRDKEDINTKTVYQASSGDRIQTTGLTECILNVCVNDIKNIYFRLTIRTPQSPMQSFNLTVIARLHVTIEIRAYV